MCELFKACKQVGPKSLAWASVNHLTVPLEGKRNILECQFLSPVVVYSYQQFIFVWLGATAVFVHYFITALLTLSSEMAIMNYTVSFFA